MLAASWWLESFALAAGCLQVGVFGAAGCWQAVRCSFFTLVGGMQEFFTLATACWQDARWNLALAICWTFWCRNLALPVGTFFLVGWNLFSWLDHFVIMFLYGNMLENIFWNVLCMG